MDIGEVKVPSSLKEKQPQCTQKTFKSKHKFSANMCCSSTEKTTADTLNFNFDFDSCLFFPISSFRIWFALVRCKACNKFECMLCKGWMRRNNSTGFIYQFIDEWQKECLNSERRELATRKSKEREESEWECVKKKRTRTMKSKFPIGFGSIERHTYPRTHRHTMHVNEISLFSITLS